MNKCNKCNKDFKTKYNLDRHKSSKTPCNLKNLIYKCIECKKEFKYKSKLEEHKQTKNHIITINNITNNDNSVTNINDNSTHNINNIQNNIHLTLQTNGFSETNLDALRGRMFNEYIREDHILDSVKMIKDYSNENKDEDYYMDKYLIFKNTFKTILEFFKELNFNLAYEQNHNCKIFLFAKSSISNFIEYHLLEIDNTRKQYNLNFVKYEIFIEGLLNLMKRLNERYDNENFEILLNFIDINKRLLLVDNIKNFIETELLTVYNKFKIENERLEKENNNLMNDVIKERQKLL
jgi:hypothetical protein